MHRLLRPWLVAPIAFAACLPAFASAPSPTGTDTVVSTGGLEKPLLQQDRSFYMNNVAPAVDRNRDADQKPNAKAPKPTRLEQFNAKHSTGFPPAAKQLAKREALATEKNVSPRASAQKAGQPTVTHAKLLTLLVEFNPDAKDDFSGFEKPNDPFEPTGCITEPAGTFLSGPLHNELPDPAKIGRGTDNNTLWVKNFSSDFYQKMLFSTKGVQKKIRKDLDGGVDISGRTVKNFYAEMSKGRYDLGGTVSPWLMLPHSEAWYSADTCAAGSASDVGHPDNPLGTGQMAVDAVKAMTAADPGFRWADYDAEDQGDADGDGNLYEPDGAIDHLVVLHAGKDQASDGGAQGTGAEWSSSQVVGATTGGVTVPAAGGLRVYNYTTQPENAGIGVIAHEFGHDLGLPDLYDAIDAGLDTDVGWWDLMSTGSHSGPVFQTLPTHMGAWSKYVLGWLDPKVMAYGSKKADVLLGQGSRPPKGTEAAVKINLPDKHVQVGAPHSGDVAWWTSDDQDYADVRLTRSLDVPSGGDVRFWSWDDYTIEELWDYGFIEVSTDDGSTWTQLEVKDASGKTVSTDADPNGNLSALFGGLKNGLTGDSGGYRHDYVDLTPYAGDAIKLRLRYATDAAFEERGWFADDFSMTTDGATVWSDDVEGGSNGWAAEDGSFTATEGAGWVRTSGSFDYEQYYLAEWRNYDGYDKGLRTPYATRYEVDGEWNVTRTPYNAPGLLIWQRDQSNSANDVGNQLYEPPSIGSKGTVLLVDAHYDPERLPRSSADAIGSALGNLQARQQANDVAFGPVGRRAFTYCVPDGSSDPYATLCTKYGKRSPVTSFTDTKTWYPGLEYRPDLDPKDPIYFRDADASTVVPSKDNQIYSTRIVDSRGKLVRDLFGTPLDGGHALGTGNPRDGLPPEIPAERATYADLSLGVKIKVEKVTSKNSKVRISVRPGYRVDTAADAKTGSR